MLCEGSPLFFYTLWGLVTASGTSHSARRLTYCPAGRPPGGPLGGPLGRPAGVAYSTSLRQLASTWTLLPHLKPLLHLDPLPHLLTIFPDALRG